MLGFMIYMSIMECTQELNMVVWFGSPQKPKAPMQYPSLFVAIQPHTAEVMSLAFAIRRRLGDTVHLSVRQLDMICEKLACKMLHDNENMTPYPIPVFWNLTEYRKGEAQVLEAVDWMLNMKTRYSVVMELAKNCDQSFLLGLKTEIRNTEPRIYDDEEAVSILSKKIDTHRLQLTSPRTIPTTIRREKRKLGDTYSTN